MTMPSAARPDIIAITSCIWLHWSKSFLAMAQLKRNIKCLFLTASLDACISLLSNIVAGTLLYRSYNTFSHSACIYKLSASVPHGARRRRQH